MEGGMVVFDGRRGCGWAQGMVLWGPRDEQIVPVVLGRPQALN